jgi:hypothetical protein
MKQRDRTLLRFYSLLQQEITPNKLFPIVESETIKSTTYGWVFYHSIYRIIVLFKEENCVHISMDDYRGQYTYR